MPLNGLIFMIVVMSIMLPFAIVAGVTVIYVGVSITWPAALGA